MSTSRSSYRPAGAAAVALALVMLIAAASCSKSDEPVGNGGTAAAPGVAVKLTSEAEAGEPVAGGSLTFGLNAETDGWSPWFNRYAASGYIVGNAIYDPLFAYDANGEPQPYLAESATKSADFKEWKIKLRPDVTFHNGEKLDAKVVADNFRAGMGSPLVGAAFSSIDEVVGVAGSLEVTVKMKAPWSTFPHTLTSQLGYIQAPALMIDPKSDDSVRKPIGTGPFYLDSWVPDQNLKVKKFDQYWRAKTGHPVYLDSIEFKVLPDFQSRGQSLEGGSIDVMETGDADQILKFTEKAEKKEFQLYTDEGTDTSEIFIALNTATPPFNDPLAREIIALGVDTPGLSDSSFRSVSPAARGPFGPESPFYTETDYPKYDIEKAKAKLEEYKKKNNGQTLRFSALVPPAPEYNAIAQNLKSQAAEFGVEVDIQNQDQTTLIINVLTGNYQASGFILFGSPSLDREYVFIASDPKPVKETSLNFTRMKDDVLIKAMNDARATDDKAKQLELYKIVQKQLAKNMNFVWLVHARGAIVFSNTAHGFESATLPDGKPAIVSVTPFTYQVWVKR